MQKAKILIVDDEETLAEGLKAYLEFEGYDVASAGSAEEALLLELHGFDLILLDIMMDKMNGVEMARVLKANTLTANIPIIFLTAKSSDDDMVAGLRIGADDYITKPFSIKNVLARIESVLRRARPHVMTQRDIVCNRSLHECIVDGKPVKLPRKEFELLALLVENPGRIFSREELLERIWDDKVLVVDRVIDVYITRIRRKIAPYNKHLVTRSGYGYGWQN